MMKIALITPFPPYRGGISKHSENLYKELSLKKEVRVYNFSRLYPNLLFPGKSQYDSQYIIDKNYNVVRMIDSINPITWKRVANHIIQNNFNKVIFRYWTPFFIPCYISIVKRLKKYNKNISIYSICDNVISHENFIFQKFFIRKFLNRLNGIIIMSHSTESELLNLNKSYNYKKLFLPILTDLGEILDYTSSKKEIGLKANKKTFLFFGLIREYKGLDILLRAINKINRDLFEKFEFLIVGENYENLNKYKNILDNSLRFNVKWITEYIPEDRINIYFSSCDYVVLPYKTSSQSGIIPMAYHYQKPVIVSNLPGLTELVVDQKTGHIFNNHDVDGLAKLLEDCITDRKEIVLPEIEKFKNKISTEKFTKELLLFIDA